jgi:hypothetical protein
MDEFERRLLQNAWDLGKCITRVADLLGISFEFARRRLDTLGVRPAPKAKPKARTEAQRRVLKHARATFQAQRATLRKQDTMKAVETKKAGAPVEPEAAPKQPETAPVPENGPSGGPGGST